MPEAVESAGQELPRANFEFHHYCRCGACVWDSPYAGGIPSHLEEIICWNCGRDNTPRTPISYRLKRFYYRVIAKPIRRGLGIMLGVRL